MAEDELKDLPPEERIKKLKEFEEKKKKDIKNQRFLGSFRDYEKSKKEIDTARKLIQESETELSDKEEYKTKVPIPEMAKKDLSGVSKGAQEILKAKGLQEKKVEEDEDVDEKEKGVEDLVSGEEKGEDLETTLSKERVDLPLEMLNSEYALQLSRQPMDKIYQEIKDISQAVEDKGYVNREEERRVEYLSSAVEKKVEAADAGAYSFTEQVATAASMSRSIGKKIRGMYKSGGSEYQA